MSDLDRRHLFRGALTSGALLAAGPVQAGLDPIGTRVRHTRRRWAVGMKDAEDLLFVDRLETDHPKAREQVRVLARGLGAFAVVHDLFDLEPEEQVHPEVQSALRDALQAIGEMGETGTRVVDQYTSGHGRSETGENDLRIAIRAMRLGVKDWKATVGQQRLVDGTLHGLAADERPGRLLARVRKQLGRSRRVSELGRTLEEAPDRTGLMAADARLERAAHRGMARFGHLYTAVDQPTQDAGGAAVDDGRFRIEPLTRRQWAAMVGLGLVAVGGLILYGWAACAVTCGDTVFIPLVILGIAIFGLALWGMVALHPRSGILKESAVETRAYKEAVAKELRPDAPESIEVRFGVASFNQRIRPADGPKVILEAASTPRRLVVSGSNRIRKPGWGSVNPNGRATSAGADAPLPGAPEGALIARTNGPWRFVGTVQELVVPAGAQLEVNLNLSPHDRTACKGKLNTMVSYYRLGGEGLEGIELPADLVYDE